MFFSSKCSLFHNSNVFGSCFIHILYTVCAKILKNNSGAKRFWFLFAFSLSYSGLYCTHGGSLVWCNKLKAGRSRVRSQMVSLEFFIDIIHSAALWPWNSTQPLTQMSTRNISWGKRRPVRRTYNLTTFVSQLSWNLGTSSFWKPQGLSRPAQGLLYLYLYLLL